MFLKPKKLNPKAKSEIRIGKTIPLFGGVPTLFNKIIIEVKIQKNTAILVIKLLLSSSIGMSAVTP